MSEEKQPNEAWRQVGQQFQSLGESLAEALRVAWEDEENRRHVQEMRAGLEKMVHEVGQAIHEASESPEAKKAARSAKAAGAKAWRDARPHVVSALRSADAELQKIISQMDAAEE
jgi:hypothetical protein